MDRHADRQADKELVRSRVRLDELARDLAGCDLKPRGPDDLWACCPFHSEDTPSFHIRPGKGLYKCFGCGESGDVFSFVQAVQGCDFRQALEFLADRAGVTLSSLSAEDRRRHAETRRLRDVLVAAGDVFQRALREDRDDRAWRYMQDRGFRPETLEAFGIGFVPHDLLARLRGQVARDDLDRSGFTRAFGGRLSFGIRDAYGTLVGFGARTLAAGERPKYVNTRETPAFNKRSLLYGLDRAARAIQQTRQVVVMEGYTDVMMAHQQGVPEAVATMGTSLTADHVRALRSRTQDMVFVFDGDGPGLDAAERAVRLTLEQGLECRVLSLPDGADPCDWFAGRDRAAFRDLLASSGRSTVAFLCWRGLSALDPRQPGGREQVAREVLELTRNVTDPMRREGIAEEIARECGVDRNLLRTAGAPSETPRTAPTSRKPARIVRWDVAYQYVVVGALADRADVLDDLDELDRLGALPHEGARRLRDLALELLPESGSAMPPVDAMSWIDHVRDREPRLVAGLERVLFPPPELVLPSYEEALAQLRDNRRSQLEKEARHVALSQPDIEADNAALRALDASLKTRQAQQSAPEPENDPPPSAADSVSAAH